MELRAVIWNGLNLLPTLDYVNDAWWNHVICINGSRSKVPPRPQCRFRCRWWLLTPHTAKGKPGCFYKQWEEWHSRGLFVELTKTTCELEHPTRKVMSRKISQQLQLTIQNVGAGVSLISTNIENKQISLPGYVSCVMSQTGIHLSQMKCQILSNIMDFPSSSWKHCGPWGYKLLRFNQSWFN